MLRMMMSWDRMRRCHEDLPCPGHSEAWFGPRADSSFLPGSTRSPPFSVPVWAAPLACVS
jgi:hypothetical protein